ncbi:hypothetical protein AX16_003299 [Volvariella volvacea WC 439]|nr:hypothetical protein AX16_003299 [Volvariella volvacea WC 439]
MDVAVLIEPRLPQDVERVIFELAAREDRSSILVLMQVARRVYAWLEHMLHEIVILPSGGRELHDDPDTMLYLSLSRRPDGPQTRHVRHLLIHGERHPAHETLLPHCHNIQDLALWNRFPSTAFPHLSSVIHSPHRTVSPRGLLRLSVPLKDMFPDRRVDFSHEALKDLTHLDIAGGLDHWEDENNLSCLKKLRYLSFPDVYPGQSEVIRKSLEVCEALEVVVLYRLHGHQPFIDIKELPSIRRKVGLDGTVQDLPEDRVVVFSYEDMEYGRFNWLDDWVRGALGKGDLWAKAEKIIEGRRVQQKA